MTATTRKTRAAPAPLAAAFGMRATLSKKSLNDGLSMLERVIPSRSSNPLLTAIKVTASERGLTLEGTNLEIDLSCFVPAEIQDPSSFVVPAHLFAQIVRNLGGDLVELELQAAELTVRAAGSDFRLQTGDLSAYPELNFPEGGQSTIDSEELSKALSRVRYAASNEAFQAVFRGLKYEQKEGRVRMVASDGFRLAYREFPAAGEDRTLIIPARSADELIRVLGSGNATLNHGDGTLGVTTDRARMNIRLLDGTFPDYEKVIPKDARTQFTLSAASFKEAVSRVAVLADKSANNRVELIIASDTLQLTAEGEYGRAHDTLQITASGVDAAMSVAFNARYLLDALGPLEGDVTVLVSGTASPVLFSGSADPGYRAVVVPLRV